MARRKGILVLIYHHSTKKMKKVIEQYLSHKENGWYFSKTLRDIYKAEYNISVGYGSYGCFHPSRFPSGTVIGNYCSIARNVTILNANHPMEYASMHPMFYDKKMGADDKFALKRSALVIGHDVWIGQDVIITKSCRNIGNGAIIGAGSIVTKDVCPYTIVAGNPAKEIRKRFDDIVSKEIDECQWFLLNREQLKTIAKLVDRPIEFANAARKIRLDEQFRE